MTSLVVQSTVVRHKIKNISANNEATLLNLAGMLHPMKYTSCTFWCCYGNMLGSSLFPLQNQILPFVATQGRETQRKVGLAYVLDRTRYMYFALLSCIFKRTYFPGHMHFKTLNSLEANRDNLFLLHTVDPLTSMFVKTSQDSKEWSV